MELSTEAIDNQGLFSDYYLENVFGDRPDVEDVIERADESFERVRGIYDEKKQRLAGTKEGQTEKRFIHPILEDVLGWDFIAKETVQGQKGFGEPDCALFYESETYRQASREASDGKRERVFRRAAALAESKKWHLSLDGTETPDTGDGAPSQGTPGAQLLRYFQWTDVSWGILTNGNKWRLYTTRVPSPVDTYLEFDLEHILGQPPGTEIDPTVARTAFRLFYALFRARAFEEDPTLGQSFIESVFEESVEKGEELEDELTERVFDEVFIELATGLYEDWREEDEDRPPDEVLDKIYNATLRLLYRLLFLLYAEERDLLPVRDPRGYYRYSLTRIAQDAREEVRESHVLVGADLWGDLAFLFREIINTGEPELNVPTYNGNLFDVGNEGNAWLDRHTVPDAYLAPALVNLTLMDPDDPDSRGVDYKALDVRQLGSIYEGLLEHQLRYAEEDLAIVKDNGTEVYEPQADVEDPVEVVEEGELYLQTDEAERKKTGSYYTPHYVVEYIVENTLGPILNDRIEEFKEAMAEINEITEGADPTGRGVAAKLEAPRRRAREALLSLHVCDPAMGSGHFLVHAVDYITNRIGAVALERDWPVNPIREELDDIRSDILDSLDKQNVQIHDPEDRLDDFTLLKRLVMKRCIYGVDLSPMAVELAKLSLWLRSFTVGAPLSFLDHHLKPGNSLIGTTVGEVKDALEAEGEQFEVFGGPFAGLLQATELMQEVAQLSDATIDEVRESAERFEEYQDAMHPYKRILDLWISRHFGNERAEYLLRQFGNQVLEVFRGKSDPKDEKQRKTLEEGVALSDTKSFFHWELEFPEVYYDLGRTTRKQNPGFDAVIGNPPWVNIGRVAGNEEMVAYAKEKFESAEYQIDLYTLFLEKGVRLVRKKGVVGKIVPDPWLGNFRTPKIRKLMLVENQPLELMHTPKSAFAEVEAEHLIALIQEGDGCRQDFARGQIDENGHVGEVDWFSCGLLREENGYVVYSSSGAANLLSKIEDCSKELGALYPTVRGVGPYHHSMQDDEVIESRAYHADHKKDESFVPELKGKHLSRYAYQWENDTWISYGDWLAEPREERFFKGKRLLLREILGERFRACVLDEELVVDRGIYIALQNDQELDLYYALSLIGSPVLIYWFRQKYSEKDELFPKLRVAHFNRLPIREIDFTTPAYKREQHVEALIRDYEASQSNDTPPVDTAVLEAVKEHLNSDPERADVVHDMLVHLAYEMTQLKEERQTYNLDVTDYVTEPSEGEGVGLREIGRYQPADGVTNTILADKTDERSKLHIHNLLAEDDATDGTHTVRVRAVARFKPEGERNSWPDVVPSDAELDQNDYIKTEPIDVCVLYGCDKIEAGLAIHWLRALNNRGGGYSGYRDNATSRDYSLLDRIFNARFPDPSDENVRDDLRPFLDSVQQANELDQQIQFTDGLIDQIVYRLYGLENQEIALVEEQVDL